MIGLLAGSRQGRQKSGSDSVTAYKPKPYAPDLNVSNQKPNTATDSGYVSKTGSAHYDSGSGLTVNQPDVTYGNSGNTDYSLTGGNLNTSVGMGGQSSGGQWGTGALLPDDPRYNGRTYQELIDFNRQAREQQRTQAIQDRLNQNPQQPPPNIRPPMPPPGQPTQGGMLNLPTTGYNPSNVSRPQFTNLGTGLDSSVSTSPIIPIGNRPQGPRPQTGGLLSTANFNTFTPQGQGPRLNSSGPQYNRDRATVNPHIEMQAIQTGWKNGMSNGLELDRTEGFNLTKDLMRAVTEGEESVWGREGQRTPQQQREYERVKNILRENPGWRNRIEGFMEQLALAQMGGAYDGRLQGTYQNLGQNLRVRGPGGRMLSGRGTGDQYNNSGLHYWYMNRTPDWQDRVSKFRQAYQNQSVDRTPDAQRQNFDWSFL